MSLECIKDAKLEETGFNYTMSLIQGKYKMFLLYALMGYGTVRFNEMKKYIGGISYKTLSVTLKELEADGLVHREEMLRYLRPQALILKLWRNIITRSWMHQAEQRLRLPIPSMKN